MMMFYRLLSLAPLCLPMLLTACQSKEASETKFFEYKGPQVASMVVPDQDKWLVGFIPDSNLKKYDRMVGFGDSLSDTGNLNRNTLGIFVNKRVYWEGRWSNGPVWMEYAAAALGANLNNYSVGAAETREKASIGPDRLVIPGLGRQIDQFLRDNKSGAERTLIAMWIGSNNYLFEGNSDPQQTVADIRAGIEKLIARGFTDFSIGRVGDLSGVDNTSKTREELGRLGPEHNRFLDIMLAELRAQYPTVRIMDFNSDVETQNQINDFETYEFRDVTNRCYSGDLRGNFTGEQKFCDDFQGTRLWDNVHPNTKAHCYYAVQFLDDLGLTFDRPAMTARCRELDPQNQG